MTASVFDDRVCQLGEGPLWHPERKQLFWFDILGHKLLSRTANEALEWQFDDAFSAAGWIDADHLLVASATGLWRFSISDGALSLVCPLEADNGDTRSNDGRADPWGGFWIGTMGRNAEPKAGAIYRYYKGALTKLFDNITISNAICFDPQKACAYFTDTASRKIMRVALDRDGWPEGDPRVFVDLGKEALNPDGAVTDSTGALWVAQWGAGRIARFDEQAQCTEALSLPAIQTTCPAFGGPEFSTLFVTSAAHGLSGESSDSAMHQGKTFAIETGYAGQAEPQVTL